MVEINWLVTNARLSRSRKEIFMTMAKVEFELNQLFLVPSRPMHTLKWNAAITIKLLN